MRIYNPEQNFAMLEMKQKQGAQQLKRSLKISREDAIRIIKGDLLPLLTYPDPFGFKVKCWGVNPINKIERPGTDKLAS